MAGALVFAAPPDRAANTRGSIPTKETPQTERTARKGWCALFVVDLRGIEPLSENRRYDFLRGQSLY